MDAARNHDTSQQQRPAKRRRVAIACTSCRHRKSKCDGHRPVCSPCKDFGYDCSYSQSGQLNNAITSRSYLSFVDERLASTERLLRDLADRVDHIERGNGQRPNVGQELARHTRGDLVDEGEQRSGQSFQDATDGVGSIVFSQEKDAGYFGPSSNISFTRNVVRTTTSMLSRIQNISPSMSGNVAASSTHMLHVSRPGSPNREPRRGPPEGSIFSLPPEDQTRRLIDEYFSNTGLLFPYIHKSTFLETYQEMMSTDLRRVRRSWLGLLNMILAMATSATYSSDLTSPQRAAKSGVFFLRALGLCESQMRSGGSLEIVQLLLLMSQYLQGTERSTQTWNIHGLAVKSAYQLGLHSKDALSQYPPLEREMRVRTWYGCVILDRLLAMTLGRPFLIPESHVKLDMPRCLTTSSPSDLAAISRNVPDDESVAFYNSTITLYKVMSTVLDTLYGGNLGCDNPLDIYETASILLHTEQQLAEWYIRLPSSMPLIEPAEIAPGDENSNTGISRYRVILTLRYLNLRVLAHRPILQKLLGLVSDHDCQNRQITTLRQIGLNSLRICIQSALQIVELIAHIINSGESQQHLGAWWFSLYYTFNAALVLYSSLLIYHDAEYRGMPFAPGDIDTRREHIQKAIECLHQLDRGNRMADKCAEYTARLARILDSLFHDKTAQPNDVPGSTDTMRYVHHLSDGVVDGAFDPLFDQTQMPFRDMDVSELMDPADLDFLSVPLNGSSQLPPL